MSELAYDQNGDPISLPAAVSQMRVRCFTRPGTRGAPENCLDTHGNQLRIPPDTTFADFRALVNGVAGRYRLDPLDDAGRIVPNVPAAYVTLTEPPRNSNSATDERDSVIRALAQANAAMTTTIAERFAGMMQAAAELLRAADGAGLPRREPLPPLPPAPYEDDDLEEDDDDEDEGPRDMASLLAELLPTIQLWLATRAAERAPQALPAPAAPAAPATANPSPTPATPPHVTPPTPPTAAATTSTATPTPAIDGPAPAPAADGARNGAVTAAQMAHLAAIQTQLTPQEVRVIQAAALRMTPAVRADWLAELAARSVEEAVTLVRSMLPKLRSNPSKDGGQ